MRKQSVVRILATAILLLVVTCFSVYYIWNGVLGRDTNNEPVEVFTCISTDIESYTIILGDESFTLKKSNDKWYIEDSPDAELNTEMINKLMASASKITANGTISKKDLNTFKSTDTRTVYINVKGREQVVIRFLGTRDNLCAFKISGDRRIYVMYESTKDILTPTSDTLRVNSVFPQLIGSEALPEYYKYTDYDGSITEIRLKTSSELNLSKNNRYIMEKPYKNEVDDELFEQQIALKIPAIKATAYEKSNVDKNFDYELESDKRAVLRFRWEGNDEVLYLGKKVNGMVFAMKNDSAEVFTINSTLLEFLQIDPFFIMDNGILKSENDNITSVNVRYKNEKYSIMTSKSPDGGINISINGKTASRFIFEEIINALGNIKYSGEVIKAPENSKDIIVDISYKNTGKQTIYFAKAGDKTYAVYLNGKAEFEVDRAEIDELIKTLRNAINNPMQMD